MTNEFCIEGTVQDVQTRESAKGNKYRIVQILAEDEIIPLAQFGKDCSSVGDMVRVTGKLGSNKSGFLQIVKAEWEAVQSGGGGFDPGPIPASVESGDLPF